MSATDLTRETMTTPSVPIPASPGRISWQREALAFAAGLAVLALLPFVFTDSYSRHVLIMVFIYAVVASNWDLSLGYGCLLYTSPSPRDS